MKDFIQFYNETFLHEHRRPINRMFHYIGVYLSLSVIPLAVYFSNPFLLLAYLPLHGVPGLIGHYFFEKNNKVGDLRINRKDYPIFWFIAANNLMAFQAISGRLKVY
jgi:hypothetical protein